MTAGQARSNFTFALRNAVRTDSASAALKQQIWRAPSSAALREERRDE
jgi:hypothetical protein